MVKIYTSPIGDLFLKFDGEHLTHLLFCDGMARELLQTETLNLSAEQVNIYENCKRQLDEYFDGKRKTFDLKIKLDGTEFRKKVWAALETIPYGETKSYKDIALKVGNPLASRAVGSANHSNPVSIIVPCHRVIGAHGKLLGYGGGIWRKQWLLEHEKKVCASASLDNICNIL